MTIKVVTKCHTLKVQEISLDVLWVGSVAVFSLELRRCCCSTHQYLSSPAGSAESPQRFLLFVFLMLYKVDSPDTGMDKQQRYHDVCFALLKVGVLLLLT